jgi:diguanylate cyclase (GGDEF)-like protein
VAVTKGVAGADACAMATVDTVEQGHPGAPDEVPGSPAHPAADGAPRQELANAMLGAVLAHVRAVGGEGAVDAVLAAAGERRTVAEIEDPVGWSSHAQGLALFLAAIEVLGDPDAARKAGAAVLHRYYGSETVTALRSLGSPAELLRIYPAISAKQSAITRTEVLAVEEGEAVIAVTTVPPVVRHRVFCDYTRGAIAEFPVLFGMDRAEVTEVECQARGDRRCLLRVRWDPQSSVARALDEEVAELRAQVAALGTRYEALEAVATELSATQDIDGVLQTITRRAGIAVRAPRYLLVARLPRDRSWRVHHVGFDDAAAAQAVDEVLAAPLDGPSGADGGTTAESRVDGAAAERSADGAAAERSAAAGPGPGAEARSVGSTPGHVLLVEVASARTRFGRLAAFYPEGFRFLPQERSLLAAYAGHAAAALETAAALDEARERNETLTSLLTLGTALAEATTHYEVAQRIAAAVPTVVGVAEAHVLLWDAGEGTLERAASSRPPTVVRALPGPTRLREPRLAARLALTPGPTLASVLGDPLLASVIGLTGLSTAVVAPVITQGQLRAVVVASGETWSDLGDVVRERLSGVCSLAATALASASQLDEARHQALHDALTDLPNPRLFEERLEQALAAAERSGEQVAVVFVDLDRFKEVNDTYGHAAGDELLRHAAGRLLGAVRSGDTVARMGGDEFAIVLRSVGGQEAAERVAGALVTTLAEPFELGVGPVVVGASVGVALATDPSETAQAVVRRADAAMYLAKASGRQCFRLADPSLDGPGQ